jgi:hypothetical protein
MLFSAIMTLSSLWALYYLHYGTVPETHQQGLLTAEATASVVTLTPLPISGPRLTYSPFPTPLPISGPRLTYSPFPTHLPVPYVNEALEKEKQAFQLLSKNLKNHMCYYNVDTFNTIIHSLPFFLTLIYIYALCLNSCNRTDEINVRRQKQRR